MFTERLETITSTLPLSLVQVKKHLVVEHDDDDGLIAEYTNAALEYAEQRTELSLRVKKFQTYGYDWECGRVVLKHGPVRRIESVTYMDQDGAIQSLGTDTFGVYRSADDPVLEFHDVPPSVYSRRRNAVQVTYYSGFGLFDEVEVNQYGFPYTLPLTLGNIVEVRHETADKLPEHIRQAVCLLVGHWYENRETVLVGAISGNVPHAADALLNSARIMGT